MEKSVYFYAVYRRISVFLEVLAVISTISILV